ncbi:MAG: amidohydrolase [bacterium]|nr:amidohydrolase [bacterium]
MSNWSAYVVRCPRPVRRVRPGPRAAVLLATLLACGAPDPSPAPDLVLTGGRIITLDPDKPDANAIWLSGGAIRAVGSSEEIAALAPTDAKRIDLQGQTVVPGFNDNHVHAFGAGRLFQQPVLHRKSCEEIEAIIAAEVPKHAPGELIEGAHWDYPGCPHPHREMLDRAAPDNPVSLLQFSAHASWVNSRRLEEMGIDRSTVDPQGGQIVRDARGEPTGVLRDTAMQSGGDGLLLEVLSPAAHRHNLDVALDLFRRSGITSVQDNTWQPITVWHLARYRDRGDLTARFSHWPMGGNSLVRHLMDLVSYDGEWLSLGPAKHFSDGAFSTRTAWLLGEGYEEEPSNRGAPRHSQEEMNSIVEDAAADSRQIAIHAIGDAAVQQILDAVEHVRNDYPQVDRLRIRLEHVQLVAEEDVERMREFGLVANLHPFALATPNKDIALLGKERALRAYPYKTLLDSGVPISCGSDVPAEVDYSPLLGMYYLVTRMNIEGTEGPHNSVERFTPLEALRCYTLGSAYAEFKEDVKGSITPGKWADLAVLSEDPTAVEPARIKDIEVSMTLVAGRIVYPRE